MTDDDIYNGLTEILQDLFMRDDLAARPDLRAPDVDGWDSFKQIELVLATEERFGVKLTTQEIDSLKTIGDLARIVSARTR